MTEGVVVGFEAVEVQQHEGCFGGFRRGQVCEQLAPVAEPREGVGRRIDPARAEHPQVLLEDQRHADDYRYNTGRREASASRCT